ncbi:FkbM family methyltransferase [Kamptonema sp. UHCC 0994]|uniref:FkbM family methyltransferase n=1 Tax=Kamptonema sp. UHCC 0994 TaxID=3031329 RepID=UPI0023B8CDFA|nr:FkbM family methyltransferase [Kamptonema sp. UHCC 0994]MDF0553355.1 FkbM family methyltransferase [Kamptonema sp. UHCC 0994]
MPSISELQTASFLERVKKKLQRGWKKIAWKNLGVNIELHPELTVKIESEAEFYLYNDLFCRGEYDLPIQQSLASVSPNRLLEFLDLGANVGYFPLRIADLILQSKNPQQPFQVTMVEGSPVIFEIMKSRLNQQELLKNKVKIFNGLVGERQGSADLYQIDYHVSNSIFLSPEGKKKDTVSYIDLTSIYGGEIPEIDLLKVDIEGCEQRLLENYPELLAKVKSVVIELHKDLCDVGRCSTILNEAGFTNHKQLKEEKIGTVDFFWKNN